MFLTCIFLSWIACIYLIVKFCAKEDILHNLPNLATWKNMCNCADTEHKANIRLLEEIKQLEKENRELKEKLKIVDKNS